MSSGDLLTMTESRASNQGPLWNMSSVLHGTPPEFVHFVQLGRGHEGAERATGGLTVG